MKFGLLPISEALGGILAHSLQLKDGKRLRKGTFLNESQLDLISASGISEITVAVPEKDDVLEDEAATKIAEQFSGISFRIDDATTGRVNIFSNANGVFRVDKEKVDAINAIDPGITIATLDDFKCVNEGRMIATIKIIPYCVSADALNAVIELDLEGAFSVLPFKARRIGVVSTILPSLKTNTMDKTIRILEERLALSGSTILEEVRVEHDIASVAGAINSLSEKVDMLILFGASAISDICDVIPAAIEKAGGKIIRFGMPVDPGNLLLIAALGRKPILGAPGCARSPAENGFDWVLQRLLADIDVANEAIAGMGVGGLLMETGARPHPREKKVGGRAEIAAIILAAGQSRRMGDLNKMTVCVHGKPMVRHVVEAANNSNINSVSVVTGSNPEEVADVLDDMACRLIHNPDFELGLSASLRSGIASLEDKFGRAIIMLGDMPFVTSDMINQLIEASDQNPGRIIIATHKGKRGNPVLWPRRFFAELQNIEGDTGARHIIGAHRDLVVEVELGEAVHNDIDTKEALEKIAREFTATQ